MTEEHAEDHPTPFPESLTRLRSEAFANNPIFSKGLAAIEDALRDAKPGEAIEVPNGFDIKDVLVQRGKVHGEFSQDAAVAQGLKSVMHRSTNWATLEVIKKEALENIATKIARILSGDSNHVDAWTDVEGYARLVRDRL